MSQPDALQQATERLDAAVDQLESFLRQVFAERKTASPSRRSKSKFAF